MAVDRLNPSQPHMISRRGIWSIPEKAEHVGKTDVTAFEAHQHLVIFLGHKKCASILSAHRGGNPNPVRLMSLFMRVETDFNASWNFLVDLGNDGGNYSLDQTHSFSILPVNSVV